METILMFVLVLGIPTVAVTEYELHQTTQTIEYTYPNDPNTMYYEKDNNDD